MYANWCFFSDNASEMQADEDEENENDHDMVVAVDPPPAPVVKASKALKPSSGMRVVDLNSMDDLIGRYGPARITKVLEIIISDSSEQVHPFPIVFRKDVIAFCVEDFGWMSVVVVNKLCLDKIEQPCASANLNCLYCTDHP